MHEGNNQESGAHVGDEGQTKKDLTVSDHEHHKNASFATLLEKCSTQQGNESSSISAPYKAAAIEAPITPLSHEELTIESKRKRIEVDASEVIDGVDVASKSQPNRRKMRRNAISPNGATAEIVKDVCLVFQMDDISIINPTSPTLLNAECSESKKIFAAEGTESTDEEGIDVKSPAAIVENRFI